ncbi:hypothetical protein Ssi03_74330 [Sphaerisporangium siamense]|uniref:Uncharacterized protein n=1 Tax=Sphaerisporangium siamense TaxID=795645 RepID=A0A7W7D8K3_9ACTN|nr:hypothetical protein [Sphaerisporangium siamense]MBB4702285.1 hypothetical protein [Sphaerisporangium siamense]GII89443.1 hypothetical protein Ssi03_74330 [Sphaerisporangium siamense]
MADYEIPDDMLKAQVAFYEADAVVQSFEGNLPPASEIVAGEAAISPAQEEELAAARRERGLALDALYAPHDWWGQADSRLAAREALQKAGWEAFQKPPRS